MRVLTDYAHNDLWHSMVLLFEDRFGWDLYRPIGMDWYPDVWRFEHDRLGDVVARQFLAPWSSDVIRTGHSERYDDMHPGRIMKMVTMDQARELSFDLVISTLAENEEGWHRFAREIGAHYGIQVGNQGAPNAWGLAEFALLSVTTPGVTPWMPHVTYHQEFSLDDYRYEWPPAERDLVATRVQCLTDTPAYQTFRAVAELTPEARFRHYGHCNVEDELWGGNAASVPEIARQMRASRVAWHDKRWSDGYGHVLHSWAAVGRPIIGSSGYYTGRSDGIVKLGGALFTEGETSFDIDTRSVSELAGLVRRLVEDDDFHRRISDNVRRRFEAVVSFDAEADSIRAMLEGVMS
jgi:hypothetical protein